MLFFSRRHSVATRVSRVWVYSRGDLIRQQQVPTNKNKKNWLLKSEAPQYPVLPLYDFAPLSPIAQPLQSLVAPCDSAGTGAGLRGRPTPQEKHAGPDHREWASLCVFRHASGSTVRLTTRERALPSKSIRHFQGCEWHRRCNDLRKFVGSGCSCRGNWTTLIMMTSISLSEASHLVRQRQNGTRWQDRWSMGV